jgi:hypothetical protein
LASYNMIYNLFFFLKECHNKWHFGTGGYSVRRFCSSQLFCVKRLVKFWEFLGYYYIMKNRDLLTALIFTCMRERATPFLLQFIESFSLFPVCDSRFSFSWRMLYPVIDRVASLQTPAFVSCANKPHPSNFALQMSFV